MINFDTPIHWTPFLATKISYHFIIISLVKGGMTSKVFHPGMLYTTSVRNWISGSGYIDLDQKGVPKLNIQHDIQTRRLMNSFVHV